MLHQYSTAGSRSQPIAPSDCWLRQLLMCSRVCYLLQADTVRSMLQQLDSDLISKENTINEQNNKLVEKETVIQSNKADIECLEKKLKVHEEKVKQYHGGGLGVWRLPSYTHYLGDYRLTFSRQRINSVRMIRIHSSKSCSPESRSCSRSCLSGDAWSSTCTGGWRTQSWSGRKNVWVGPTGYRVAPG